MPDIARASLTVETTDRDESTAVSDNAAKTQRRDGGADRLQRPVAEDIQNTSYYVATNRDYTRQSLPY